MMKTHKFAKATRFISLIVLLVIAWNCENVKDYTDPTDSIPPGKVTSVEVENRHGGAMITYALPPDKDLMGVKAVYSFSEDGAKYESYSSSFRDTIVLAGFPNTNEYVVNLYAIDQSRNLSEPVPVTIKPLIPPVDLIRKTLKVQETFSGVYCSWENAMEENITVSLYVDSIGEMMLDDNYFSKTSKDGYAFRGFTNKEYSFRVEIRDRWMNYATPLDTVLTPMFEEQIKGRNDEGKIMWSRWGFENGECRSRGDNWTAITGGNSNFSVVFDNNLFDANNWFNIGDDWSMFKNHVPGWTDDAYAVPAYMSLDMGRPANYSRLKIYMRARSPLFSAGIFTVFELWGTNNPQPLVPELTNEDRLTNLRYWTSWPEIGGTDEWKKDWTQLGDYSLVLPSGATLNTDVITAEDQQFIRNGFEYEIDLDKTNVSFRYLRFVVKKSNVLGRRPFAQMGEMQFFGSYADE